MIVISTIKDVAIDERKVKNEAVILMNRKPESGKDTKVLIQKN